MVDRLVAVGDDLVLPLSVKLYANQLLGTMPLDNTSDGANRLAMLAAERSKLAGVATGATANDTNASLRDRTTHTGTQTSTTISDFTEAVQDVVGAFMASGTGATVTYNDAANSLTISAAGTGGGIDPEAARDTIGAALIGLGNITVTVNDAADTITITTTATANSTDAALRDRSSHTGVQAISTIEDLQTTLDNMTANTNSRVPSTRQVNGKALSTNITLDATDVGARASTWQPALSDLPSGSVVKVSQSSGGTWPARPTVKTDVMVIWIGYPGLTTLPGDFLAGTDAYWYQVA